MYPDRDHEYPYRANETGVECGTSADIEEGWKEIPPGHKGAVFNVRYQKVKWRKMTAKVWSEHPRKKKFTWNLRIEGVPAAACPAKGYIFLEGIQNEERAQKLAGWIMASIAPRVELND